MSEPKLKRSIGTLGATMLAFNGAVGAGIFALPGTLAADFGAFSPWLFPLAAVGLMLVAWPFARSVAAFSESGGPATYGRAFGRLPGFELGWVYYVSRAAAFAANANVLTAYAARWWAGAGSGPARWALLVAVTALFAVANIVGVRRSLRLLGGLTILKALPLLLLALAAIALTLPPPPPGPLPPLGALEAGILVTFYAFIGFENATVPAGETERPERALPRAIFATLAAVTLIYFLIQLAFVSALPAGGDATSPLVDLAAWLAGPAGVAIITVTAIASLAGNLHSNLACTPRLTSAMASRGDLPQWFARVHPRFATPANSIAFMAVLAAALALSGSFVLLAAISVLSRLLVYAATIAALPRAPGRPRVGPVAWVSGAVGIAVCGWAAAQADAKAWLTLIGLASGGLVLYAIAARVGARRK